MESIQKRSRAAILPFPGDPFLLNFWLFLYPRWSSEIDRLYIALNSPLEKEMVNYIVKKISRFQNIEFIYYNQQLEHGEVINRVLDVVQEENILLIEDDGFVFKSGVIDQCFSFLESGKYDIVGSKRGSCSQEILDAARIKFNLSYSGYGDQGPNFWPNFFFCRRSLLLKTDRNFGARAWKRGETVVALGCVVEVPIIAGDTFVNTSLQLRNLVSEDRIVYVNQYHAHPSDLDHLAQKTGIFDGGANWVHIGSLSSGVGGMLTNKYGTPLVRRQIDKDRIDDGSSFVIPGKPNTTMEKQEYERRVQWWQAFSDYASADGYENLQVYDFLREYQAACQRIIQQFGLDKHEIIRRRIAYKNLMEIPL